MAGLSFLTGLSNAAAGLAGPGRLGLAGLLDSIGPEIAATAAVAAAISIPGISYVPVLADSTAAHASGESQTYWRRLSKRFDRAPVEGQVTGVALPTTFASLADPWVVGLAFAKNVGLHLLIQFNMYMVSLNEYEYRRLVAEEQGQVPPVPPPTPDWEAAALSGAFFGVKELVVRAVRTVYEHVLVGNIGLSKAQPFLRNSQQHIVQTLLPKYATAPLSKQVFSYFFSCLHGTALFWAAEATVSVAIHAVQTIQNRSKLPSEKAALIAKSVTFQLGRCVLLLMATSGGAAVGTLIKPGLGTRAGALAMDYTVNRSMQTVANVMLQ